MRLSALLPAALAMVLAVALVPAVPAGGQSHAGADQPAPAVRAEPSGEGWTPGELDVDWAAFAAEHRQAYESSRWASAADVAADSRDALRDDARAAYAQATGEGSGAGYADVGTQRSSALAQQYYDECDDGSNLPDDGVQASRAGLYRGGADTTGGTSYNPSAPAPPPQIDLRSIFMLQSTDDGGRFDQTAFLVYACQQWGFENLGAGGITFGLHVSIEESANEYPTILGDPEAGPDFIVTIFPERSVPDRPYQIMAIRTPSRDRSTWTVTFLDRAERIDGYEIDGVVPTSAIGDFTADDGFAWTVEAVDTQQPSGGRDWFPERNWQLRVGDGEDEIVGTHIPQFPVPEACGLQAEAVDDRITYRLQPQAVTPNDDGWVHQWYQRQIQADDAWDTIRDSSTGGRSRPVTIAVVDTGIDSTRADFVEGGVRVVGGLDAVYGLELEGEDNGGAIGPIIGPRGVAYEAIGVNARNSDRDPHGTGVASLIGARGNNTFGIAGVDWGARLMPIRVNDVNGCISNVVVAEGIKWAVDHGADVVHVSLGAPETALFTPDDAEADTPECNDGLDNDRDGAADFQPPAGAAPDLGCDSADDGSEGVDVTAGGDGGVDPTPACSDGRDNDADGVTDTADADCSGPDDDFEGKDGESEAFDPLRETIDYAMEQGVPVVTSAGNFGSSGDPVVYPAAYPGVIAVGASDRDGNRAFYSSTGRWLDVIAPGGSNTRTLAGDLAVLWELDRIRTVAGTSFAAPLVTGAISLYLGLNPHIARPFTPSPTPPDPGSNFPDPPDGYQRTVDDVSIAVQNGVVDRPPAGHDLLNGWGRLDVDRMLDVQAVGGPLIDPARAQLPRTNADSVVEAAEDIALSRPTDFPPFVTFTRSDVAVDALAGAPLLSEGPLLVARQDGIAASTMEVLAELMPDGGQVYLLGGEAALGPAVESQLRDAGYAPTRLAGPSRVETAVAIADEVRDRYPGGGTVAVARADGGNSPTAQWADALSGGAWAADTTTPLVVTGTDQLHPAVAEALDRWGTTSTVVFGGTAAISDAVVDQLPSPTRIAGAERAATAVEVADRLWSDDVDGYTIVNGYYARGWVHALAAAGWAADEDRPLLYTGGDEVPAATLDLLAGACPGVDEVRLIGGGSLISHDAEDALAAEVRC
ncbi:S8 family serine peptidase [Euzebya sp.]|uniref:S8 family serine peptidase n=1 Tax=Euzebya sp. TaxID=1971409 RepID=UPI0035176D22